ncbi:MAG: enoyl-CoA hydratase [Pseudomonadota bacterium]
MTNVLREDTGAVARLTLNRPKALNALSEAMLADLQSTLDTLAQDPKIRVIVIAAAGRAFCAGHDLREMTEARAEPDGGAARFAQLFDACAQLMQTLPTLPQPVIAEVSGLATAAGCQLVASCDMAIATEDARFGVNGVNIGLFCSTPMVALSRNIPRKHAFEMLTTGSFIDAQRACELGLVNHVVRSEHLVDETMYLANTVADKLGSAVRIGKRAFYDQIQMPLDAAYRFTGEVMVANMLDSDTTEGIAAFLEKRDPEWTQ